MRCSQSSKGRRKCRDDPKHSGGGEDAGDGGHSGPAPPPPSTSGSGQCPCIPPCPLRTQALFSSPALTEALGYFAIQRGVTVGQSVAEVASAVEGVVYDGVAGNCYQPRLHAYKVLVADAGGLGGGGGAGRPNSCGGGGEPAI